MRGNVDVQQVYKSNPSRVLCAVSSWRGETKLVFDIRSFDFKAELTALKERLSNTCIHILLAWVCCKVDTSLLMLHGSNHLTAAKEAKEKRCLIIAQECARVLDDRRTNEPLSQSLTPYLNVEEELHWTLALNYFSAMLHYCVSLSLHCGRLKSSLNFQFTATGEDLTPK